MKTYRTSEHVARLALYLVATGKAFAFDGHTIAFMASNCFIDQLQQDDPLFEKVHFEII